MDVPSPLTAVHLCDGKVTTEVRVYDGRDCSALPGGPAAACHQPRRDLPCRRHHKGPLGRGPCSLDRGLRQDPEPGLNRQLLEPWPRVVSSS